MVVDIYIVYEINKSINIRDYPTLENCSFWAVRQTKNADIDKYKYSGYGTGYDRKGSYSISNEVSRNVIIFGVNVSSSSHINNKKREF